MTGDLYRARADHVTDIFTIRSDCEDAAVISVGSRMCQLREYNQTSAFHSAALKDSVVIFFYSKDSLFGVIGGVLNLLDH